ncbi:MAG: hypothetical protein GEV06_20755 [Luteitalea sp.]|nr:hypothetical protein [Luteitalea sp.]
MQDYYRILDPISGKRLRPVGRMLGASPTGPSGVRMRHRRAGWSGPLARVESALATRVSALPSDLRWFGDEVAVDFPSATAAVERARRRFFERDDGGPATVACVALTGLEARRGGRVPIRICLPTTCAACGGRGESWGARCEGCAGEGSALLPRYLVLRMPPGLRDGVSLHFRLRDPNAPTRVVVQVSVR